MIARVQIALEIQDLVILETVVEVAMEVGAVVAIKEFSIILILASTS